MAKARHLPQRQGDRIIVSLDPAQLTERRISAGHTQEALGVLVSMGAGYISKLERGQKNAGIDTVRRLAAALGCEIEDITVTVPVTDTRSAP
jgi:transcriptional regulator with XRE-family HTH domain